MPNCRCRCRPTRCQNEPPPERIQSSVTWSWRGLCAREQVDGQETSSAVSHRPWHACLPSFIRKYARLPADTFSRTLVRKGSSPMSTAARTRFCHGAATSTQVEGQKKHISPWPPIFAVADGMGGMTPARWRARSRSTCGEVRGGARCRWDAVLAALASQPRGLGRDEARRRQTINAAWVTVTPPAPR